MAFLGSQLRVTADVSMSVIAGPPAKPSTCKPNEIVADSRMWSRPPSQPPARVSAPRLLRRIAS